MIHGFEGDTDYCLRINNPGWLAEGANMQMTNWILGPFTYLVDLICKKNDRKLPPTLHHQCDRGSDQVAGVWLWFWSFLQQIGLFADIWVSNLQRALVMRVML